jgi:urease accessory protein
MRTGLRWGLAAFATATLPATALAHTGVGQASGVMHGFMHPIGGLDHILAMVAVGGFAAYLGGRALWLVPAAFVAMMAFGGWLGVEGVAIPYVEAGIAASVIVLGVAVAARLAVPAVAAATLVGVFAVFHGHAHGAEMPMDASGLGYAAGFMLATALLHSAGLTLGIGAEKLGQRYELALRASGCGMAALGLGILANVI